jgi:hypothetical protein
MVASLQLTSPGFSHELQSLNKIARAGRYASKLYGSITPLPPIAKQYLKDTKVLKTLRLPTFVNKLQKHSLKAFKNKTPDFRSTVGILKDSKAIATSMALPCKILVDNGLCPEGTLDMFTAFHTGHLFFCSLSMLLAIRSAHKAIQLSSLLTQIQLDSSQGASLEHRVLIMQKALCDFEQLKPKTIQKKLCLGKKVQLKEKVKKLKSQLSNTKTRTNAAEEVAALMQSTISKANTIKYVQMVRVAAKATKITGLLLATFTPFTTFGTCLAAGSALVLFGTWRYTASTQT